MYVSRGFWSKIMYLLVIGLTLEIYSYISGGVWSINRYLVVSCLEPCI